MPRPDAATYDALVRYIETGRDRLAEAKPNPGRPTLHRLNRTEYGNAVRDLLALEIDVAEMLPADDIGYGFDNIGDVLQVSPVLLERYLSAARKISRTAVGDTTIPVAYQTYTVPHGLIQADRLSETSPAGSRGGTIVRHLFPVDGEYEISVTMQRNRDDEYLGLERERKLDLRLDDQRLQTVHDCGQPEEGRARRRNPSRCASQDPRAGKGRHTRACGDVPEGYAASGRHHRTSPGRRGVDVLRRRRQHHGGRSVQCARAG